MNCAAEQRGKAVGGRTRWHGLAAALLLTTGLALGACSDSEEEFPTLGSVPDQAPAPGTTSDQAAGLAADNQNAQYTGQAPALGATATTPSGALAGTVPSAQPGLPLGAAPGAVPAGPFAYPETYGQYKAGGGQVYAGGSGVYVDSAQLGASGATAVPLPAGAPGQPIGIIYFANGSASLDSAAQRVARDVAAIMAESGRPVLILGHASMRTGSTDPATHQALNLRMSQARAEAVARALVGQGANPAAIQAAGVGDSQPVFYEFMPTGEAGNRRVEIYLQ